jgi:putative Mn2+ efflux pump MntP
MFALLLVAVSAGLSNMTGSIAIGISGVDAKVRLQVGLVFGLFESLMPVVGLVLGRNLAGTLGKAANPAGGGLLALVGLYTIISAVRSDEDDRAISNRGGLIRLLVLGAALSIDNLVIGFALGTYHVGLIVAAVTIGAVSVSLSLLGLEFGSRLGERIGQLSEYIAGALLIGVGAALAAGVL